MGTFNWWWNFDFDFLFMSEIVWARKFAFRMDVSIKECQQHRMKLCHVHGQWVQCPHPTFWDPVTFVYLIWWVAFLWSVMTFELYLLIKIVWQGNIEVGESLHLGLALILKYYDCYCSCYFYWLQHISCWLRGSAVERRSLAGELSLSYARPVSDGWP